MKDRKGIHVHRHSLSLIGTTIGWKNGTRAGWLRGVVVEGWLSRGGWRGMVDEGGTYLLLAPSPGAIVTIRGNIGKSIWLPLPSSLSSLPVFHPHALSLPRPVSSPSDTLQPSFRLFPGCSPALSADG